jgi:hypothetical protein
MLQFGYVGNNGFGRSLTASTADLLNALQYTDSMVGTASMVWPRLPGDVLEPGCAVFVPLAWEGRVAEPPPTQLRLGVRRYDAATGGFVFNLIRYNGAALSDTDVSRIAGRLEALYAPLGVSVAVRAWDYEDGAGASLLPGGAGPALAALREVVVGADPQAINVWVADGIVHDEGGLFGFAGGVPGPVAIPGTASSAVVVSVDMHRLSNGTLDVHEFAMTVGHEAGHQLGLNHTTERAGGAHDMLADTPECPVSADNDSDGILSAEECLPWDGHHVMFWTTPWSPDDPVRIQDDWSPMQQDILQHSPAFEE